MFLPGQSGNPEGRSPVSREQKIWDILDNEAIPAAIRHLYGVVMGTDEDIQKTAKGERVKLKNDAAKALLNKAPERLQHAGVDGVPLFMPADILMKHALPIAEPPKPDGNSSPSPSNPA